MKNIFLFFTLLLCIQTSAQGWKLELSSNVEIKTWKLTSKSEVKSAPLLGATIKLMKGSTLIEQTKSGQASPESSLRAAPQGNHRQAKILTLSRQLIKPDGY